MSRQLFFPGVTLGMKCYQLGGHSVMVMGSTGVILNASNLRASSTVADSAGASAHAQLLYFGMKYCVHEKGTEAFSLLK